jgi:imidazolonepropionase-like amidohydrolase
MFKNDYTTFPVEKTFAHLKAGETLSIEINDIKEITANELGKERQFGDIINYGAVLISDELILWAGQEPNAAPVTTDQPE